MSKNMLIGLVASVAVFAGVYGVVGAGFWVAQATALAAGWAAWEAADWIEGWFRRRPRSFVWIGDRQYSVEPPMVWHTMMACLAPLVLVGLGLLALALLAG